MGSAEPNTSSATRTSETFAPAQVTVPTMIADRYVLSERLGEGGMASVHLAYDLRLQRCVAIKVLKRQADPDAEARNFREARAMAQLNHPNVMPVHDVGKDGEQLYIVMDHVRGETLRSWLTIRSRSRAEVCRVFAAAARGLAAAHWFHRTSAATPSDLASVSPCLRRSPLVWPSCKVSSSSRARARSPGASSTASVSSTT